MSDTNMDAPEDSSPTPWLLLYGIVLTVVAAEILLFYFLTKHFQ